MATRVPENAIDLSKLSPEDIQAIAKTGNHSQGTREEATMFHDLSCDPDLTRGDDGAMSKEWTISVSPGDKIIIDRLLAQS